jgi:class 3 adenylate cyclase
VRRDLPPGTITFLLTDVEGSTRLLQELGAEGYAAALAEHRSLIRETCTRHDGVEVDTQGDAFLVGLLRRRRRTGRQSRHDDGSRYRHDPPHRR